MLVLAVGCSDPGLTLEGPCSGPTGDGICLREIASGLRTPTHMAWPPGDDRLMVSRTIGVVDIVHPDGSTDRFLDMRNLVRQGDEQGLFALAFHPDYAGNGTFFVSYTSLDGNTQIDRMTSSDPNSADDASRESVLTVPHDTQFGGHHNGARSFSDPMDTCGLRWETAKLLRARWSPGARGT